MIKIIAQKILQSNWLKILEALRRGLKILESTLQLLKTSKSCLLKEFFLKIDPILSLF